MANESTLQTYVNARKMGLQNIDFKSNEQKNAFNDFFKQFATIKTMQENGDITTATQNDLYEVFEPTMKIIQMANDNIPKDDLRNAFNELLFVKGGNTSQTTLSLHMIATLTDRCHDIVVVDSNQRRAKLNNLVPLSFKRVARFIYGKNIGEEYKQQLENKMYKIITLNNETKIENALSGVSDFYDKIDYKHHGSYHKDDFMSFAFSMARYYNAQEEFVGAPMNRSEMIEFCKEVFTNGLVYPDGQGNILSPRDDINYYLENDEDIRNMINECIKDEKNNLDQMNKEDEGR